MVGITWRLNISKAYTWRGQGYRYIFESGRGKILSPWYGEWRGSKSILGGKLGSWVLLGGVIFQKSILGGGPQNFSVSNGKFPASRDMTPRGQISHKSE